MIRPVCRTDRYRSHRHSPAARRTQHRRRAADTGRAIPAAAVPVPSVGVNPLLAAAAPVLAAAIRISSDRGRPPDLERLRRGMVEAMRDFEKQALATGLDTRSLRAARYALCATIDDLVLSTPWGAPAPGRRRA